MAAETVEAESAVLARREGSSWVVLEASRGVLPPKEIERVTAAWSHDAPMADSSAPSLAADGGMVLTLPPRRGGHLVGLLRLERGSRPFGALERDAKALVADILAAALPGLLTRSVSSSQSA
jgi:hypothetical protein